MVIYKFYLYLTRVKSLPTLSKVSQKDIAESLNISRVTVTKALQGDPDIARETVRKVKERALEMGYIPDFIGRSLASKRTFTIGLVVPKIAHSFFSYSIERMYEAARKRGYNIIPTVSFEDEDRELDNMRTLLSMRVDGIILDIAQNSKENSGYELARRSACKVLFYDRCPASFHGASILTDDRNSAFGLTRLLIQKGYRKIYHFAGPFFLNISQERKKGYEAAMHEAGLPSHIFNSDMTIAGGLRALKKLKESGELPDAVIAVNDPVAHGVYEAACDLGLRIPEDIAVAGFGDVNTSALLRPPMTSIQPPLDLMAEAAVETLVRMIENDQEDFEPRIFETTLIERGST